MKKVKIGVCQMMVTNNKDENLLKAKNMIKECKSKGAEIVVLPEMFNCPYDNKYFPEYAEEYPNGKTYEFLKGISKDEDIVLISGSIPERKNGNIYNTSFIYQSGELLDKHRKMHLFDIDVKGKISFKESDTLTSGEDVTIVDTIYGKIGVAICYDIRFPELIRLMALEKVNMVFVPAAFNMTTGPSHWETLFKSRALDNQIYMIGAAPARNLDASYTSYANSLIVNPWGQIENKLEDKEGILIGEIDFEYIDKVREELPVLKHRRLDVYDLYKK